MSRRSFLKAGAAAMVIHLPSIGAVLPVPPSRPGLGFSPIPASTRDQVAVARGYRVQVLLAWGDPLFAGAPAFDPEALTAAAQARQFGYNCDYVGYLPLPPGSGAPDRGLLVVNHEYTNPELMFPDYVDGSPTPGQVAIMQAAHGMSIVEVSCDKAAGWAVDLTSAFNRRITAHEPCRISGPAAGHKLLRTGHSPTGRTSIGTLANCSASVTPWGTVLSGEENFHLYFGGFNQVTDPELRQSHARFGVPRYVSKHGWESADSRFDLGTEPNEPFHFGWVVEVDPYDPESVPVKRTALGRLRREGATSVIAPGGQIAVYSGDDLPFEYIYKFVTRDAYDPGSGAANRDILDHGTLYVARFDHDGTGLWLPLQYGGALSKANGFANQGDVLLNAPRAADLLLATKMDRPEDIKVNPVTNKVYVALTNNPDRGGDGRWGADSSNPRVANTHGHILEITEAGDNFAARRFTWEIFMLCGDPDDPTTYFAGFPRSRVSAISRPDNLAFDSEGNLWIATDGQPVTLGVNDGLYAVPVSGPDRGHVRRFFSGVPGAEICSPCFAPGDRTLFLSVQHPGETTRLDAPSSRWPFGDVPRPAVVAISENRGRRIGSGT